MSILARAAARIHCKQHHTAPHLIHHAARSSAAAALLLLPLLLQSSSASLTIPTGSPTDTAAKSTRTNRRSETNGSDDNNRQQKRFKPEQLPDRLETAFEPQFEMGQLGDPGHFTRQTQSAHELFSWLPPCLMQHRLSLACVCATCHSLGMLRYE